MTEYNGSISNLLQGVSQQPRLERRPEQLESQVNCLSSVTKGLGNRPGTQLLTHGTTNDYPEDAAYYTYDRGDTLERYSIVVQSGSIKVTDLLTGDDRIVSLGGLAAYLESTNPKQDFRFHTIADTTFILNRSAIPTMSNPTADDDIWQAIIYCKRASWGFDYKVIADGVVIAFCRTPATVTISSTTQDKMITLETSDVIESLYSGEDVGNAEYIGIGDLSITNVTAANPGVVTVSVGPAQAMPSDGDTIRIDDVVGMTELNDNTYTVANVDLLANTFEIVDTSGFTTYVSGGTVRTMAGVSAWATANGATASMFDDVIHITHDTIDLKLEVSDGNHGNDLTTFGQAIDQYSNLPRVCYDGYKVLVSGIDQTVYNDYYVAFEAENGAGIGYGVWKETIGFGINQDLNPETMPHILTREADGSFLLQEVPWVARSAGDDNTNPIPSFVGTEVSDIMTYQGRLVLISEENTVASVTFDHYNFFADTVTTESDTDPIDTASSDNQVTNLHHGLVFNASLVLFSDRAQFVHPADTPFTINTFGLSSKSRFKNIVDCSPVASATSIFFAYNSGQYTGIREMQIDSLSNNLVANEISAQVDSYIPGSAEQLVSSTDYNILIVRPDGDPTALYVFQWFTQDNQRKQAAWHKWEFTDSIQHIALIQDKLYMWKRVGSVVSVEYIDLSDTNSTGVDFPVRLDRQRIMPGIITIKEELEIDEDFLNIGSSPLLVSYDSDWWGIDVSAWVETRGISRDDLQIVAGSDTGIEGAIAQWTNHETDPNIINVLKTTVFAEDIPTFIVGTKLESEAEITNPYVRSSDGSPKTKAPLRISTMKFNCSDTGSINIIVTKDNSPTYTKEFDARLIGNSTFILDEPPPLLDVELKVPIRSDSNKCNIKVYSDSHLPFYVSNIDWSGSYYETGRRTI